MHLWPGSDLLQLFWFLLTLKLLTFHQEVCNKKKPDNLPTREAAGCLCVKIRIMTWQKSGSLPLFFLEQNIGWYKALPVSDLKVWQLSTRLFESPSGSRIHIVVKTKKCSVNKNHNFLLFTMIKSGGFSKIPINLFFKPSFSTGWSLF